MRTRAIRLGKIVALVNLTVLYVFCMFALSPSISLPVSPRYPPSLSLSFFSIFLYETIDW